MLSVATVATTKTYTEFLLLKYSLEQYHSCSWYVSCDQYVYDKIKDIVNVTPLNLVKTDDCDHNINSVEMQQNFINLVLTKFDACEAGIKDHGYCLFFDSDVIFTNPIEDRVLDLFKNPSLDAIISPHMTNNWANEAKHGYYNVGMFVTKNLNMIKQWRHMSKNHRQLGMYYEQKPLEYVQRSYITANFPIYYNIGWWRFNEEHTKGRLTKLRLEDDKIYFGNNEAVNFHMHTLKNIGYQNFGQFLVDKVFAMMKDSNNTRYKSFLEYYENISKTTL
jgi:hypothetical protein